MKIVIAACLAIMCASSVASAKELDSLLVYGDGFIFSVKEPSGWVGDTDHAAAYQANLIIYQRSSTWRQPTSLIRILIVDKTDEHVELDLAADMDSYKRKYPGAQFKTFSAPHPKYATYGKLFIVPGQSDEYVVYVNPGPGSSLMFSVSMNEAIGNVTPGELAAFRSTVTSLAMLKALQQGAPAAALKRPAGG